MKNVLRDKKIIIGEKYSTEFVNANGVYQDGTVPFCRDKSGKLWAMGGHSHMGDIAMFSGKDFTDMKLVYPITLNFCVGHADYAFDKVRYPEGVKARGSVWPFGLYICPKTNRFFCFFHNETGWNGKGTAYDSIGYCETPHFDSDFRHIGLMHSDDEGQTWTFDRWVVTAEDVCFTERFNPDAGVVRGQKEGVISLGSGDFTFFDDVNGDYIYLIYNIIKVDMLNGVWKSCNTFVARSRKRDDGVMGDFVKYYNGSFCEAGNFGKESPIVENSWHSRVIYSKELGVYIMASSPIVVDNPKIIVADYLQLRTSPNLYEWSQPLDVEKDGKKFGSHYHGLLSYHGEGDANSYSGNKFTLLVGHNGVDVVAYDVEIGE
ncbi:MAG: hypothetical protein E7360_06300 [Clostridiales bacterium]|nr:hypothetical protein [Clostridiales bacterium]